MLDPGFTTEEMSAVFSAVRRVEAMAAFEAALALALADIGIAPRKEADTVAAACRHPIADPEGILAATWSEGTPLIRLLSEIRERLTEEEARWLHHGATTQDTVDTATMTLAGEALGILDDRLSVLARLLAGLVVEHRAQPQIGRTFLQDARPTTFGFRAATWLDSTLRHVGELRERGSGLAVQLGGPVGNLAPYGDQGADVMAALAERLGLQTPALPWHTDRSRIWSLVASLEACARTIARIASDVALLASSDIAEIRVRPGGSSSMTEKRNPIDAVRAVAAASACTGAAGMIVAGSSHELDRGIGGWHVEWMAVPMVFETVAASVEAMTTCLEFLEVDAVRMKDRAGSESAPVLDQRLIDRVLADYNETVGSE